MALFNKTKNINIPTVIDISSFVIIGGVSAFTIGVSMNDVYCFNVLKKEQYKSNNLYCRYYNAKYTKLFVSGATIIGLLGGGLYGYYKKPLMYLIY